MAGAIRPTFTKPIPEGARPCKLKDGSPGVKYTDKHGREHAWPLSKSGRGMIVTEKRWRGFYTLPDGGREWLKGFSDYDATVQAAAKREREAAGQKAGLILVTAAHLGAPIDSHREDYVKDLRRVGRAEDYCKNTDTRLKRIFDGCEWTTLTSIRPDTLTNYLARLKDGGAADKTVNDYLAIARCFCNWAVKQARLGASPLKGVERIALADKTYERRALTLAEVQALLATAPPYRRLVYLTALRTGLRYSELKSLQWQDVHLDDGQGAHIRLRAKATKAKRADVLPLRADLADELRAARPADADPSAAVFPRVPYITTFHADREAAKIPHLDAQGRAVDFHSLRVTFCTMLQMARTPMRTAMMLLRHTDPRLTMNTYIDTTLLDGAGAVESLPDLSAATKAQEVRAVRTGTDDIPETLNAESCTKSRVFIGQNGLKSAGINDMDKPSGVERKESGGDVTPLSINDLRQKRTAPKTRSGRSEKLPGQDSNLEWEDQNLLCCQLHHRVNQSRGTGEQ